MIADVVIVLDEGADLPFEISGQVVVVEQDAVLQGLMPALDLSLGLGMIGCPAHMLDAFVLAGTPEKLVRDIRRATRKQYSAEEKIRIVLEGLRGEENGSDSSAGRTR